MRPLADAERGTFKNIRFVLTDMDDTLTLKGRLHAQTYSALERLQDAGIVVIPVTAAPAGWCDQMARMWPIDSVIGENGAFHFRRRSTDHKLTRVFWHDKAERERLSERLDVLLEDILLKEDEITLADHQPFRISAVAFSRPSNQAAEDRLVKAIQARGGAITINSIWVLASFGTYDKLKMSARILQQTFNVDAERDREAIAYVGDSINDAPMFGFFKHTIGVSTVIKDLPLMPVAPAWITNGPGGVGFVEASDCILRDYAA